MRAPAFACKHACMHAHAKAGACVCVALCSNATSKVVAKYHTQLVKEGELDEGNKEACSTG